MRITTKFNIYPSLPIKRIKTGNSVTELLPQTFNLKEYRDISTRYNYDTDTLLYPVYKQHACGACWAWSIASMLSDRYALAYNTRNPRLSPTPIMSGIYCKMAGTSDIDLYNACDGGSSYDALILLTKISQSQTPVYCDPKISKSRDDLRNIFKTMECDSYDWCEYNPDCNKTLTSRENSGQLLDQFSREGELNKLVPEYTTRCQIYRQSDRNGVDILPTETNQRINIKIRRCYSLEDIESIKYSLFTKGTVITNFVIFPDLIYKPDDQEKYWLETDNIYIHKKGCKIYRTSSSLDNDVLLGYHSATFIGWDKATFDRRKLYRQLQIPFKEGESETIEIPYWIGRNTWGTNWNDGGYFKIAMTNKQLGINTEVGADIPISLHVNECYLECGQPCDKGADACYSVPFGGCCAADLDTGSVNDTDVEERPDRFIIANNSVITKYSKNISKNTLVKNTINTQHRYIKISVLLLLILLGYLIYKKIR